MAYAERGMSAPPEVVFSTATDPDRLSAWLPTPLRTDGAGPPAVESADLSVRWSNAEPPGFTAQLRVRGGSAGGANVRLDLDVQPTRPESVSGSASGTERPDDRQLTELAERSLASLAREVADNLTAG